MSMKIDETRRDGQAIRVDHPLGGSADPTHLSHTPILHGNVAQVRRHAAAVINSSAFDQDVIRHDSSSCAFNCVELNRSRAALSTNRAENRPLYPLVANISLSLASKDGLSLNRPATVFSSSSALTG